MRLGWLKDLGEKNRVMGISVMALGRKENFMAEAHNSNYMLEITKEDSKTVIDMGSVSMISQMEQVTKDNLKVAVSTGREYLDGLMEMSMRVLGKMKRKMDWGKLRFNYRNSNMQYMAFGAMINKLKRFLKNNIWK